MGTARTTVATDGGDAPAMCAERMSFDYGRSSFDRGCAMAYDDRSSRSSEGSMKRNLSRLDSWVAKAPAPTCRRRRTETKSAEDRPAAPSCLLQAFTHALYAAVLFGLRLASACASCLS